MVNVRAISFACATKWSNHYFATRPFVRPSGESREIIDYSYLIAIAGVAWRVAGTRIKWESNARIGLQNYSSRRKSLVKILNKLFIDTIMVWFAVLLTCNRDWMDRSQHRELKFYQLRRMLNLGYCIGGPSTAYKRIIRRLDLQTVSLCKFVMIAKLTLRLDRIT